MNDLLGTELNELEERLYLAKDDLSRTRMAEQYLLNKLQTNLYDDPACEAGV